MVHNYDEADDLRLVEDARSADYRLSFLPKSMMDLDLEDVEQDWHELYCKPEESSLQLDQHELEKQMEETFVEVFGCTYEALVEKTTEVS